MAEKTKIAYLSGVKVHAISVCKKINKKRPVECEAFWDINTFFTGIMATPPDLIVVSVDYPHANVANFCNIFKTTTGRPTIICSESNNNKNYKIIQKAQADYKINGKVTSHNLWAKVTLHLRSLEEKSDTTKKTKSSSVQKKSTNMRVSGGSGSIKGGAVIKGSAASNNEAVTINSENIQKMMKQLSGNSGTVEKNNELSQASELEKERQSLKQSLRKNEDDHKEKLGNNSKNKEHKETQKGTLAKQNSMVQKGSASNLGTQVEKNNKTEKKMSQQAPPPEALSSQGPGSSQEKSSVQIQKPEALSTNSSSPHSRAREENEKSINKNVEKNKGKESSLNSSQKEKEAKLQNNPSYSSKKEESSSESFGSSKSSEKELKKQNPPKKKVSKESEAPNSMKKSSKKDSNSQEESEKNASKEQEEFEKKAKQESEKNNAKQDNHKKMAKDQFNKIKRSQDNLLLEATLDCTEKEFPQMSVIDTLSAPVEQLTAVVVSGDKYNGYLLISQNGIDKEDWHNTWKKHIENRMEKLGAKCHIEECVTFDVKTVDFSVWAEGRCDFNFSLKSKDGGEFGISFLAFKKVLPPYMETQDRKYITVNMQHIPPSTNVTFDGYIFMPLNEKYVRLVKKNRSLCLDQIKRYLKNKSTQKLMIPIDEKDKFIEFYIQNRVRWELLSTQRSKAA